MSMCKYVKYVNESPSKQVLFLRSQYISFFCWITVSHKKVLFSALARRGSWSWMLLYYSLGFTVTFSGADLLQQPQPTLPKIALHSHISQSSFIHL